MLRMLRDALLDALAVLSPVECSGCGAPDRGLCDGCRSALLPEPTVRRLADGTVVRAALRYEGVPRRVLLALKESGRTDAARALGLAFSTVLEHPGALVVAVPTSRSAYRRRGYDPVRLLLRAAGIRPLRALASSSGRVQKGLTIDERAANRRGSFRATRRLDGLSILLVDDVVTTGATLVEAARVVREAGGTVVGAACLASTPRYSAVGWESARSS